MQYDQFVCWEWGYPPWYTCVGEDFELALSELDSLIDLKLDLCDEAEESIM